MKYLKKINMKKLKVTSYREFDTRRGVGYECKTNVKGLSIWNDGDGGCTYFSGNEHTTSGKIIWEYSEKYNENQIEVLIDSSDGISIKNCISLSRHIESALDRDENNFSLQVASAGLSEPFKVFQQYKKILRNTPFKPS